MINKAFPLDFVRQIIVQLLYRNKLQASSGEELVGGDDQVRLTSFYEQLSNEDEVDRYVSTFQDLVDQANRIGLIANGIISTGTNPSITNLKNNLIIPVEWTASFRCAVKDRDILVNSLNKVIDQIKGRAFDVAEFESGKLYMVGRVGNFSTNKIEDYDFVGSGAINPSTIQTRIDSWSTNFGYSLTQTSDRIVACEFALPRPERRSLKLIRYNQTDNAWEWVGENDKGVDHIPYHEANGYTKYKVSMSCDSVRVDTPTTLDGEEDCFVSFSGSASIVDENVRLGNDLQYVIVKPYFVVIDNESSPTLLTSTNHYLEPLELPSGNNVSNQVSQVISSNFLPKHHNDSLAPTLQYTFVCDMGDTLLKNWYKYARYGTFDYSQTDGISPNATYKIIEQYNSWGNMEQNTIQTKICETINIENNENDVLTIQLTMGIQAPKTISE